MTTETKKPKLTKTQSELIESLKAQAEAAEKHPGACSRGLSPGTSICHKTVAKSLVRLGLCEYKTAWHGQIIDLKPAGSIEPFVCARCNEDLPHASRCLASPTN